MSEQSAEPVTTPPAICLSMIVRNEAHVIRELLDSVAPYISSWVIVDTGSDDGTPDVIRNHMDRLGIPGELYQRPWRDFGHNRTEALSLAQGHGDYIWVMDADDILVGKPDFSRLDAEIYSMRYVDRAVYTFWRPQLFRDGLRVRYEGVIHEYAAWDDPCVAVRLECDCHIEYRCLGARSLDPQKYANERDVLLAELERNPGDSRSVFLLAQAYYWLGDFVNARDWYTRRVEMGGTDELVYVAMLQIAQSMANLDAPWPDVQNAYLKAWELRPTRIEPLWLLACKHRVHQRYQLGYFFAKCAAEIPFPEEEALFIRPEIYAWRATDEQAVCASWIGKKAEAFTLCRRMLARADIPDDERRRIAANRDALASDMIDTALPYPDALIQRLVAAPREGEVVVSLVAGPDRERTEHTLNSFLNCCTDLSRVGRFLVIDAGLSAEDRTMLRERYGFLEFGQPAQLHDHSAGRFWLHLGQGWRFFAPENLITRLTAVLDAEPRVFQVGINFGDAASLPGASPAEQAVRRVPDGGRYVLTDAPASGPAMFDTARLDRAGGIRGTDADQLAELGRRAAAAGLQTASLDEILCVAES